MNIPTNGDPKCFVLTLVVKCLGSRTHNAQSSVVQVPYINMQAT